MHADRLPAISLGVLVICVLVGFEAVAPLPSAFTAWARRRAGLARVVEVLATVLDDIARRCGLRDFMASLPNGWHNPAGPNGSALSSGQRQRLLLARALLADPQVLVLDEPAAHLDADTEQEVLGDLLDATAGRTVLISTHRTLRPGQFDSILRGR